MLPTCIGTLNMGFHWEEATCISVDDHYCRSPALVARNHATIHNLTSAPTRQDRIMATEVEPMVYDLKR